MSTFALHWQSAKEALAAERRLAADIVRVEEHAFLPAALELVERPVSPTRRVLAWVLLAGLVLTILWLAIGRTDIVATGLGTIAPEGAVKMVQPAEAGVVRAILVADGQRVRKGQPLVMLDPTISEAELSQARRGLLEARFDVARARALSSALGGGPFSFVPPPEAGADEARIQEQLARAQYANVGAALAAQSADTRAAADQVDEARIRAAKLDATLPLLDEQIASNELLFQRGYVSKTKMIEMRRQRIAEARERDAAVATIRRSSALATAARSSAARSRAEAHAQSLAELVKAEAEAHLRQDELVKSERRASLQVLRAPVDGVVSQLSVHTVGGTVEPVKPIMVIVPSVGGMLADIRILNRDIGFVRPGQRVSLKIDAFPYTRHGVIDGRIRTISASAEQDERLGPVYTAKVSLDGWRHSPDAPRVTPGMSLTADIHTGSRSFLSYLFSPIAEAGGEAARER